MRSKVEGYSMTLLCTDVVYIVCLSNREFPAAEIATYCNIQRLNLVVYPIIGSMVCVS